MQVVESTAVDVCRAPHAKAQRLPEVTDDVLADVDHRPQVVGVEVDCGGCLAAVDEHREMAGAPDRQIPASLVPYPCNGRAKARVHQVVVGARLCFDEVAAAAVDGAAGASLGVVVAAAGCQRKRRAAAVAVTGGLIRE